MSINYSFLGVLLVVFFLTASVMLIAGDKTEADKLYNEGNTLYRSGNYQGAVEKYNAALAIAEDFKYFYQRGLSFRNLRQYDKAISDFQSSIKLKSDFALGYNALGGLFLVTKDFEKSIDAYKSASKLDPRLDRSRKGIGEAYAGKAQELLDGGKLEQAGQLIEEAVSEHSENPKLYLIASRVFNKLEKPEKAIVAAKEALNLKKKGSKGAEYFELGIGYKKMQDYEKAREAFVEAKKDPAYTRNAQYELDGLKGK